MRTAILVLACLLVAIPCKAETIIVDPNGSADFTNIQDAINGSWHGDTIIVRPGTYNGNISFNGKAITLTSTNSEESNIVAQTIIATSSGRAVTFAFGEGSSSIIKGFTINGGGILCEGTSPIISKNVIKDCRTSEAGAAVCGANNAAPTISYNVIKNNTVDASSTSPLYIAKGGAISECGGFINHNIIIENKAYSVHYGGYNYVYAYGGALYRCNGQILNNVIVGNQAWATQPASNCESKGGGLYECSGIIKNNTIAFNRVIDFGGGLYNCNATVKNNIIAYNGTSWTDGGGIYGSCQNTYNDIWSNQPDNFAGGALAGNGDIAENPLFSDLGYWDDNGTTWLKDDFWVNGDYHLESATGRWDTDTETWVIDDANSRCIDAGDPCEPIDVEPNPNGGRINMGAYGGTAEASKSPSGIIETICTSYPTMDFNHDCKVDFEDFATFTQSWLDCNLDPPSACWE